MAVLMNDDEPTNIDGTDIDLRVHGGNGDIGTPTVSENQADIPIGITYSFGTDRNGVHHNSTNGPPNQQSQQSPFERNEDRIVSFRDSNCLLRWRSIARHLADVGFYYSGEENVLRCFKCQVTIKQWDEALDPMQEHTYQSPHCLFVRDTVRARAPLRYHKWITHKPKTRNNNSTNSENKQ